SSARPRAAAPAPRRVAPHRGPATTPRPRPRPPGDAARADERGRLLHLDRASGLGAATAVTFEGWTSLVPGAEGARRCGGTRPTPTGVDSLGSDAAARRASTAS